MHMVGLLRRHGVEPYVVLDGARLPAKAATEKERRDKRARHIASANALLAAGQRERALIEFNGAVNITPEHAYQLIHALRLARVRYVVAPYEADAQIAFLARQGLVDLVIAEDSDMLAFGCPRVFLKMDPQGNGRFLERQALRQARDEQGQLLFVPWEDWDSGDRLLEMCILNGCDYLTGMSGFGLKTAHRYLRKHRTIETVLRVLEMEGKEPPKGFSTFARYVQQVQHALQTFRYQRVFDPSSATVVPLTPLPPNAPKMPHCGADIPCELAHQLCATGDLSPDTHQPMAYPAMPIQPPQYDPLSQPSQPTPSEALSSHPPMAVPPPAHPPPTAASSSSSSSVAARPASTPGVFATAASLGFSTAASFRLRPQLPTGVGRPCTATLVQSRLSLAPNPSPGLAGSGANMSACAAGKRPFAPHVSEARPEKQLPFGHIELHSKPSARQPFKKPRVFGGLPPSAACIQSPAVPPAPSVLRRSPFFASLRPVASASPVAGSSHGGSPIGCDDTASGRDRVHDAPGDNSAKESGDGQAMADESIVEALVCAHSFTPNDRRASIGSSVGVPTLKAMVGTRLTPRSSENAPDNGKERTPGRGAGVRFLPRLASHGTSSGGLTKADLESFRYQQ